MKWPVGVRSAGIRCGIKEDAPDLGLLVADLPLAWTGVFTRNAAAAAPVRWCRTLLGVEVRALVVNSGNANACTGEAGMDAVRSVAEAAAREIGCSPREVLVASTGPIGVQLPADKIAGALPLAVGSLTPELEAFSSAILTTDTCTKVSTVEAGEAVLVGVAKGAAMIAPNMATMLAFVVTDAVLPEGSAILHGATRRTFDRISVDGCESTNDSVFLLSTGEVEVAEEQLTRALEGVCADLADQIVSDAEGGSKVMSISVAGASDEDHAAALARAVAESDLWKAAVHGGDPNWGRVLAALGQRDRNLTLSDVEVSIGPSIVFDHGEPMPDHLDEAAAAMHGQRFEVRCVVGRGPGSATVLTTDLSPEYVTLNAEGTS